MFVFPDMLVSAAKEVGISVPPNPDQFDSNEFPKFKVFCNAQLGRPMPYPGVHFDNAKIIADIPTEKIKSITFAELFKLGFIFS